MPYPLTIDSRKSKHQTCHRRHKWRLLRPREICNPLSDNTSQDSNNTIQRRHRAEDPTQRGSRLVGKLLVELRDHPALENAVHQRRAHASEHTADEQDCDVVGQESEA